MFNALWIAKTGLDAQQTRMAVTANNLANVNTTGYKRSRAEFQDLIYQDKGQPGGQTSQQTISPSGFMVGTGVRVVGTEKLFTEGNIEQTGNSLDVAIQGRGFLQVQMPDGSIAYTRDGELQLNNTGQLVTANGNPVSPAIQIPPNTQSITIGSDGQNFTVGTERFVPDSQLNPTDPSSSSTAQQAYIGNVNSKKFHLPTCPNLPAEKNQVLFSSYDEAIEAGYTPCSTCIK